MEFEPLTMCQFEGDVIITEELQNKTREILKSYFVSPVGEIPFQYNLL